MSLPFHLELFKILVCPETKAPLKFVNNTLVSTDADSRRSYPVEDGIPIMLVDKSNVLSVDDWQKAMDQGLLPADITS